MIVLGLLLILIAAGATAFAVIAPSGAAQTIEVTALGLKVSASPLAMFVAGAASLALLGLGYLLISRGARRQSRSRKELHQLRKEQTAAAASGTSADGGHRATRSERSRTGGSSTEPDSNTGNTSNTGNNVQAERRADSEPPTAS